MALFHQGKVFQELLQSVDVKGILLVDGFIRDFLLQRQGIVEFFHTGGLVLGVSLHLTRLQQGILACSFLENLDDASHIGFVLIILFFSTGLFGIGNLQAGLLLILDKHGLHAEHSLIDHAHDIGSHQVLGIVGSLEGRIDHVRAVEALLAGNLTLPGDVLAIADEFLAPFATLEIAIDGRQTAGQEQEHVGTYLPKDTHDSITTSTTTIILWRVVAALDGSLLHALKVSSRLHGGVEHSLGGLNHYRDMILPLQGLCAPCFHYTIHHLDFTAEAKGPHIGTVHRLSVIAADGQRELLWGFIGIARIEHEDEAITLVIASQHVAYIIAEPEGMVAVVAHTETEFIAVVTLVRNAVASFLHFAGEVDVPRGAIRHHLPVLLHAESRERHIGGQVHGHIELRVLMVVNGILAYFLHAGRTIVGQRHRDIEVVHMVVSTDTHAEEQGGCTGEPLSRIPHAGQLFRAASISGYSCFFSSVCRYSRLPK